MSTIADNPTTLADTLTRVKDLLSSSEESIYAEAESQEIISILEANIRTLRTNGAYQKDDLCLLFAPTGSIQDTAIDNGWGDDFLNLSEEFDGLINEKS